MSRIVIPTKYYQQFDADRELEFPAEAYGGWKKADLEIDPERTAVVVMHAWDCGTWDDYPGWHRVVDYIPRSYEISRTVFPPLLEAVRRSPLKLFHVVAPGHSYYEPYPGYQRAVRLAGDAEEKYEKAAASPLTDQLWAFRSRSCHPGTHNLEDIRQGHRRIDFTPEARPQGEEGIARNADQLFALCQADGINHLIYVGFAINGCLLLSPGGMADMQKRGMLCSTVRQAVTAIENKETIREELGKEMALWYVALLFGFVYEADEFIQALRS
ncbi:hypothetical protein N6H14_21235 [Paenibacillus sp. CC-CFT747]|nr:hypothetical protein N6H14_21235 [Paenibacillus sp. CC-CFT747]